MADEMYRTDVIHRALIATGGRVYVEIGVRAGVTLRAVRAPVKVGIDPSPLGRRMAMLSWWSRAKRRLRFRSGTFLYPTTSDEFFAGSLVARHPSPDVVFVDGLHTADQAHRDIENAVASGHDGTIVLVHDCNPMSPSAANPSLEAAAASEGFDGAWNGDVYRAIVRLRATRPDLRVAVLDCDQGIGVVRRGTPDDALDIESDRLTSLSYDDLAKDRARLLNLRPPEDLARLLDTRD